MYNAGAKPVKGSTYLERRPVEPDIETIAPYSGWKKHRGTPEECLAVVQLEEGGAYSAFVVRCDGFLVVPEAAWQAFMDKKKGDTLVTQAEGETSTGPFAISAALRRKSSRCSYRLLKVNDHHLRSLPVLAPEALQTGAPLRVLWATPAPNGRGLQVEQCTARYGELVDPRRGELATLIYEGGVPQRIPSGAVVIDAVSQAAVGMITEGTQPTRFATWRYWGDMINQVGLAPDREAALNKVPTQDSRMVKVTGGPVRLKEQQCEDFIKSFGTDVACTADFYCDINPVTNLEWFGWSKTRSTPTEPLATEANLTHKPIDHPQFPVGGASLVDMMDYLSDHSKRFLTEVEFMRASRTKEMKWLIDMDYEIIDAYDSLLEFEDQYISLKNDNFREENFIPDILRAVLAHVETKWSQGRSTAAFKQVPVPDSTHPVNLYEKDKSDFGVRNVHLNAPEICLGWNRNIVLCEKIRPSMADSFLSRINYVGEFNSKRMVYDPKYSSLIIENDLFDVLKAGAPYKNCLGSYLQIMIEGKDYDFRKNKNRLNDYGMTKFGEFVYPFDFGGAVASPLSREKVRLGNGGASIFDNAIRETVGVDYHWKIVVDYKKVTTFSFRGAR
ncbi:hypothetical protein HNQ39_002387 [Armatimonas rosea]|uniref:Uncharacterized protein n=1 Tax=Armatimonas rosea TaxID=685828 RepID=A0A7W9W6W5_ARMRO|nr:hypothetical protein [Armatimonas rosea]